jgi:hypothetical protein
VRVLIVIAALALALVLVEHVDTGGDWADPGNMGMALGTMIIEARQVSRSAIP